MARKSKSAAAAAAAEESQQSTQDLSQGMTTDEQADTQDSVLDYDDSQTQEAEAKEQGEEEEEAETEAEKAGDAGSKKEKQRAGKAKKKKADEDICTERDVLRRVPLPTGDGRAAGGNKSFTVLAWNVNGLRATVKNGLDFLRKMVDTEKPDLVCFQVPSET